MFQKYPKIRVILKIKASVALFVLVFKNQRKIYNKEKIKF